MEAILGYNWFDLVTLQLLACGDVTKIIFMIVILKPVMVSQLFGYPVGFT
jgi:hypothetical protein